MELCNRCVVGKHSGKSILSKASQRKTQRVSQKQTYTTQYIKISPAELALQEKEKEKHKAYLRKKRINNRKRVQARSAHMVKVSNEEKEGETFLMNKFKAHRNRKANTADRRENHKK